MRLKHILLFISIFTATLLSQNYATLVQKPKIDYRNHINIPPYDASLMPLGTTRTTTGVWTELNPKIPRVDYIGVDFIDTLTGWCVGKNGAIIKTTDGGKSWINCTSNTTEVLLKVSSYNGNVVIVSGYNGLILRSSDNGITFTQVYSGGSNIDLWGLQMLNDTLGWCCGRSSRLLKTTNGGQTWQQVNTGYSGIDYWSLDFYNIQLGMLACGGGKVIKTTDGGNSWIQVQAGDEQEFYTIDIIDSLCVAAGGSGGKNVYSSDCGVNWIQNGRLIYDAVNCIGFVNRDTGYAVGEGYGIRKTENRGQTWFASNSIVGEWELELLKAKTSYAVGNAILLSKSTNSSDDWKKLKINEDFGDVFFLNELTGFVLGLNLYKTTNGGHDFEKSPNSPGGYAIIFVDSLTGFISATYQSNCKIFKTTDGGNNWFYVNANPTLSIYHVNDFFFINKNIGFAVTGGGSILKTTDGGNNWVEKHLYLYQSFTSIFFIDSLTGWATNRYLFKTTNCGETWIQQTIPIYFTYDIYFVTSQKGFVTSISNYGILYKTTNGGIDWDIVNLVNGLGQGHFNWMENKYGFITGWGNCYYTIDSGQTWNEIVVLKTKNLTKMHSPLNYIGFTVGSTGLIYEYFDEALVPVELSYFHFQQTRSGIRLEWETESEKNNYGFEIQRRIEETDWTNIGFISGKGTTTEKTYYSFQDNNVTNGKYSYRLKQINYDGSYKYSKTIEVNFSGVSNYLLYQNYPNPFNSSTVIKYYLPEDTRVTLKLYDVLGNEIKTIVNDLEKAGEHQIEFNSDKTMSSGIYFYRLITNSFSRSVKMVYAK